MNPLPFDIPPDVISFLQLMITPTFGAWAISTFVESEEWFQKLASTWKSRAVFILLLVLSLAGRLGLSAMYGQPPSVQDIYLGITVAFVSYVSSKWWHEKKNNPTEYTSKERAATVSINMTATGQQQPTLSGAETAAG